MGNLSWGPLPYDINKHFESFVMPNAYIPVVLVLGLALAFKAKICGNWPCDCKFLALASRQSH